MTQDAAPEAAVQLATLAVQVTEATGELTSAADLERIVASLQAASSFWDVVALSGRTATQTAEGLRRLAAAGAVSFESGKTALTPDGLKLAWRHNLTPRKRYPCPQCEGHGLAVTLFSRTQPRYEKALAEWHAARGERNASDGPALAPTTAIALIAFLADRGDLMGKTLLVGGSDDLLAVALAQSGFPQRVLALEADPERANFVRSLAARDRLKLEAVEAPGFGLPNALHGQVAAVVLPEATAEALSLRSALRGAGAALVGFWSPAAQPLAALAGVEAKAATDGLALTDLVREFGAFVPSAHPHRPLASDPEPLKQPPAGVWRRPSLIRWELMP
ncbi:MAG: bis-aminopropyl spermidine synthase family protein [Chloroflexi bacterium]|nr:bis-aminopropyl spermidine synthase family protein [Chloroflexota bacterium]